MKDTGIRCEALTRTFIVLVFILDTPHTLAEIAEHTQVCTRTARRDLEVLQRAGFAIISDHSAVAVRWMCRPSRMADRIIAARRVA